MIRTMSGMLLAGVVLMMMVGCESQVVPSTGTRQPTDPSTVKIYQDAPKQYEVLGTVELSVGGDIRWDERGDAAPGFEKLQAKAAALGANGLLLKVEQTNNASVTAGYKGSYYQVPLRLGTPNTAVAKAIYVLKEK